MTVLNAYKNIYRYDKNSKIKYWAMGFFAAAIIFLFLPWTQNVRARGSVTTLRQEQRPQVLNSILPGKITRWYVKEGDHVNAGDTILQIGEVKEDYFDPAFADRTGEQLDAKRSTIDFYKNKVSATQQQLAALESSRGLKQQQLQNKINQLRVKLLADSAEMVAAVNDARLAELQFNRQKAMYDSGLVSLTQLEQRNAGYQNKLAKRISAENKLAVTRQELQIASIEINALDQDYAEKISKAQGDRFQSMSQIAGSEGDVAKLKNQYSNYSIRKSMYFITAPQNGQVTKAKKAGIGEMIKEGETLVEIVPDKVDYAVELYVSPVDLPLIDRGQKVQFLFDGFPAIVFSGWPNTSYGTFSGKVIAVENAVSANGMFRVLVTEDTTAGKKWPTELKVGAGAQGFALLKNVPVWYELWRNINGFPPDYYKTTTATKK